MLWYCYDNREERLAAQKVYHKTGAYAESAKKSRDKRKAAHAVYNREYLVENGEAINEKKRKARQAANASKPAKVEVEYDKLAYNKAYQL
jgi:hypothetical protein